MAFNPDNFNDPNADPAEVKQSSPQFDSGGFVDPERVKSESKAQRQEAAQRRDPEPFRPSLMEGVEAFDAGLRGAERGAQETLFEGPAQAVLKVAGAMGAPTEGAQAALAERRARKDAEMAELAEEHPRAVASGQAVGSMAPYGAVRGVTGAGVKGLLKGGAIGGGIGASQYTEKGESKVFNTIVGGLLGAFLPGGMRVARKALAKPAKGLMNLTTKKPNKEILAKQGGYLKDDKTAAKAMKSAKELDTFVTPGEATGRKTVLATEGRLTPSAKTLKGLEKAVTKREQQLRTKAREVIRSVLPPGKSEKAVRNITKGLYEQIDKTKLPQKTMKELLQNPQIERALDKASKNWKYNVLKHPPNSIGRMREARRFIDDEIAKVDKPNTALLEARTQISKALDKANAQYLDTNKLAQKAILHKKYIDKLDKIGLKAGEDVPVSGQLYNKLFGSVSKRNEFIKDIARAGGNTEQAKNLIRVLSKVKSSELHKILGKDQRLFTPHAVSQGPGGSALSALRKAFVYRHDSKVVDLITNPKYADELRKAASYDAPKASTYVSNLMGRLAAGAATD